MKKFTIEAWIILRLMKLITQTAKKGKPASTMLDHRDYTQTVLYILDTYGYDGFVQNTAQLHMEDNQ